MTASSGPSGPSGQMRNRICLVTGATSGIGQVTARALAERGATLVIVARNEERARSTVGQITSQTGNPNVEYVLADLSSQADVRRAAQQFQERHQRLHVLVNNAGAMFWRRRQTVDGLEMTFALNHLAPFLLTNLLLDTLRASAPARIVTVASGAHQGQRIPFDDLQQTHGRYTPFRAYGQSKLANLLFTYELAHRLEDTQVTANALHPGFVATNFAQGHSQLMHVLMSVTRPFSIATEEGAQTSIYLATSPEVEGVSGQYFYQCRPIRSSPASYESDAATRLWAISEQLTGLAGQPRA